MLIRVEQMRGITLIPSLCSKVTELTLGANTVADVTLGAVLSPRAARRPRQRNAFCRIGGGIEPPAPSQVVLPSCGRDAALAPELDPVGFLGLRHPRPLEAAFLMEGYDVAHDSTLLLRPKTENA